MELMKQKRIPWLDTLRFISALLVVIAHCRANFFEIFGLLQPSSKTLSTKIFYLLTSFSDDAVFVFFILSGFLVGGSTLDKLNHHLEIDWKHFAISRFVRILIPLFATLLLCVAVYYIDGKSPSYVQVIGNALNLQGLLVKSEGGVLWTMPYIVWSYVFLLSLILIANRSENHRIVGLLLFCLTVSLFLSFPHPKCFLAVALGAVAYFMRHVKFPKWFVAFSLLCVITTALVAKFAKPSISRETSMLSFVNLDVLNFTESFFMAILLSQIVQKRSLNRFVRKVESISTKASEFSYSLYLSHYLVIQLMLIIGFPRCDYVSFSSIGLYISAILICVFFGYVFYLLFEKPTNKIRNHLLAIISRQKSYSS